MRIIDLTKKLLSCITSGRLFGLGLPDLFREMTMIGVHHIVLFEETNKVYSRRKLSDKTIALLHLGAVGSFTIGFLATAIYFG